MKVLDAIQSSYEKRIELGELVALARNWHRRLSLVDSDAKRHFMEAFGVFQCVATTDQHPIDIRSTTVTVFQADNPLRSVERGG